MNLEVDLHACLPWTVELSCCDCVEVRVRRGSVPFPQQDSTQDSHISGSYGPVSELTSSGVYFSHYYHSDCHNMYYLFFFQTFDGRCHTF
jgi:hypothetical protein